MSDTTSDPKPQRDVSQIIEAAGGGKAIEEASEGKITADRVRKWPQIGIPERNWPVVMPLAGATEAELHAANLALRQQKVA